jgi:hypothetical protein
VDGTCPEVIKVYIFKADPGEDDLGEQCWAVLQSDCFWVI